MFDSSEDRVEDCRDEQGSPRVEAVVEKFTQGVAAPRPPGLFAVDSVCLKNNKSCI